jgi:hypothetical protein
MKAWQLIEDPKHWTRHTFARNCNGQRCDPEGPEAVCWCAEGALTKIYGSGTDLFKKIYPNACTLAVEKFGDNPDCGGIVSCNDNLGHEAVLSVLKELDV